MTHSPSISESAVVHHRILRSAEKERMIDSHNNPKKTTPQRLNFTMRKIFWKNQLSVGREMEYRVCQNFVMINHVTTMIREERTSLSNFENLLNIIFQLIEPGILGELIDFWARRREMQDKSGASYSARK